MGRTRRIAVLLALTLVAGASSAAAAPSKVAWSRCYGGPFQCGTVQVPLDYAHPDGTKITLALTRLPATDPAHRIGSLFLNPGGPGGSGVDFVHFAGPDLYTPEVRARFDLVGFDPRGVARSTGLRCFGTQRQWDPAFAPFPFPQTPDEELQWEAADRYLTDACIQRGGKIITHMATADVARDMDRLRAAVGDSTLSYAGVSYGSYLGVTYANLFPDRVRALVVDGVLDPVAWSTGSGDAATTPFSARLHSDITSQQTLEEFFRLCDAGDCAFGPDSSTRFAALAAKLKDHPVELVFPDGSGGTFGYADLIGATLGAMYDSAVWEDFAGFLADVESQASAQTLGADAARLRLRLGPAYAAHRGDRGYRDFLEPFPAVACADSDNPSSYAAWHSTAAASFGYFGVPWTWASSICAVWPFHDAARYMGPFTHHTADPLLVIGNTSDPATPYAGAQKVASLMPDSRLLTLHGWGHTSLFRSACIDTAITRYLVDVQLPPANTVCDQDHVPFQP